MYKVPQILIEYEFWLWEYQRRNEKYCESVLSLFDDVVSTVAEPMARRSNEQAANWCDGPEVEAQPKMPLIPFNLDRQQHFNLQQAILDEYSRIKGPSYIKEFIDIHKRYPRHPGSGYSGQEMVETFLIDGKEIDFDICHLHIPKIISEFSFDYESGQLLADFCVDYGPDIASLETIWYMSQLLAMALERCEPPHPEAAALRKKSDDALNDIRIVWAKKDKQRLKIPTEPRAIGCYLYDYMRDKGGTQQDALENFSKRFGSEVGGGRLGLQLLDDSVMRKFLRHTVKCVECCEVLLLS